MWTSVPKPTGRPYTNINVDGKTQYDQSNITYDDPNTFYDGVDVLAWKDVAKPLPPIIYAGEASGLLIPLTFVSSTYGTDWTPVPKPIN